MQAKEDLWDADAQCIMDYLGNYPEHFISEAEINRRADGKARFQENDRWCRHPLSRLLEAGMVLTDGYGKFRLKPAARNNPGGKPPKFISPEMRTILENSSHHIDLTSYT
jgi:hypothetical protein